MNTEKETSRNARNHSKPVHTTAITPHRFLYSRIDCKNVLTHDFMGIIQEKLLLYSTTLKTF